MKDKWREFDKEKTLFKSYYCVGCKQTKPCYILSQEYCCNCTFEKEQEKAKEYNDYQQVYQRKVKEWKEKFQQLQLLKNYQGCPKCKSKEIDAYSLYENNQLTCWNFLIKKQGQASGAISFSEQSKWYKRWWKINLAEIVKNFSQLPVNKNCADQWLKDKEHLKNCACLEQEAREIFLLITNSLKRCQEKLKNCQCKTSEKVRVESDYYTWCETCQREISVASKKRIIKNRNDPSFWGLEIKERILCGNCLENKKEDMPSLRRVEFNRYRKVGRL